MPGMPISGQGEHGMCRETLASSQIYETPSVLSQKYNYIAETVFGRWNLQWLTMRKGGCVGCSFR